jgi:hypothetical protein
MLPVMARPNPISLRIAQASNRRARALLRRLESEDQQQRRIRWLATKALINIRELNNVAEPKVKALGFVGRESWQRNYSFIESTLLKIRERGV